jgi:hypothetical protein
MHVKFEVFKNLEGSSVASYFHVYENEDAVSQLHVQEKSSINRIR